MADQIIPSPNGVIAPQVSAPEAPVAEPAKEISPQYLALAKQQKATRRMQAEIKQQQETLRRREDELKALESRYQTDYVPKSRLKEDAMGVLNEVGMTYDQLVSAQLAKDPVSEAMKPLQEKLTALESAQKKAEEAALDRQKREYDQALNHVRSEVKALVVADPEFEAIKANEAEEAVVELIKVSFEKDGTLLTAKEAALQVEDWLLEQAVKMAQLAKVKKRLTPAETIPENPLAQAVSAQKQQPKTLTNARTTVPARPYSQKERIQRAIDIASGKLVQ